MRVGWLWLTLAGCGAPVASDQVGAAPVAPVPASPVPAAPAPASPAAPVEVPAGAPVALAGRRIIAMGDLHADLPMAIANLRLAGLLDAAGAWSGGDAILVQTGDITDRGPDSKELIELMQRLSREAPADGGLVLPLLGNHEAMNLLGDWRYVSDGDYADFGGPEGRRAAFAPTGPLGSWLRGLDAVAQLGDTVFVHGGVGPDFAARGAAGLSADVRAALKDRPDDPVLGPEGPLWLRSLVLDDEATACPALERSLERMAAKRMIVGHTTQRSGQILSRCGGALLAIDTGISSHYGAHGAAVELRDGDAWALYPAGRVDLEDPR